MKVSRSAASALLLTAALSVAAPVAAQAQHYSADSDRANGPQKLVDKAASVVIEMERDPGIRPLLNHAVGLYVIPEYGRGGFLIGGKGGAGVVVARTRRGWSSPAFFYTGGLNIGLQIGASGGSIVYLLMDRRAVDVFRTHANKFSVDAHAGLSVVTYSKGANVSTYKGDAVLWTNMRGAYAGAVVGATDVGFDGNRAREYYGHQVNVNALLDGAVSVPGAQALTRVLPR